MKSSRDIRVIPVVLIAIFSLAVLKVAGLVIDGGYVFDYQPEATKRSWAADTFNFPSGSKVDPADITGSVAAKKEEPKPVVAACFAIGAASVALLTLSLPLAALLAIVAIVGLGTSGTQTLIYGFVANYYRTNVRGAGVAWCAGFGRLGGVGGPLLGGFLIGGGFALNSIFYVLAGLGLLGVMLTLLVPIARRTLELHTMRIEPTPQAGPDKVAAAVAPTT